MVNKFSLVMATYGRSKEIKSFLESIVESDYDKKYIEIIIVDQNDKIDITKIVEEFKGILNIIYIKSNKKGLSFNRNIGIKEATGEIIAFPDDDCEYLEDTLKKVNEYFNKTNYDLLMGRIVERDGSDSLRKWPKELIYINKNNFYTKSSSVTIFLNRNECKIIFDDNLGAGAKFGSCEDADLIYKNIKENKKVIYIPDIKIYHPHYDSNHNMSNSKIYNYALGFGAMIKLNLDLAMMILFIKAQGYHFIKMTVGLIKLDKESIEKSYLALKGRFCGFLQKQEQQDISSTL